MSLESTTSSLPTLMFMERATAQTLYQAKGRKRKKKRRVERKAGKREEEKPICI